tara:strand:- start:152 stop:361 length:210 start_codon:yes stop_codon:yes gene_type:complete
LNLRTQFEETTEDFKLEQRGSDINTLKWFVENGHKSNSLRDGYQMAFEIAETIITEYENGRQEDNRGFG